MPGPAHAADLLSVDQALERVLAACSPLPVEEVPLTAAAGRVLATAARADRDLPPFHRCAMDGYALRSADLSEPPTSLRVIGVAPAGTAFAGRVGEGQAVKVMTGAPLPEGADAVQAVERTREEGSRVVVYDAVRAGENVAPRGEDLAAGDVALPAGRVIGPAEIAVLASVGVADVPVHRRPRAVVVSTGDELVEPGEPPSECQVRNCNGPSLAALARAAGCEPVEAHPTVRDDRDALARALGPGLDADLLVVSGGVSRGERDFVGATLADLGVEELFHGVDLQPGKPLWVGRAGTCLVFGLPGNPVSALTTFRLFGMPAARLMRGLAAPAPRWLRATLSEAVTRSAGRPGALPAWVDVAAGGLTCRPLALHGSGDFVTSARANATWLAPKGQPAFTRGESVQVLLHEDWLER